MVGVDGQAAQKGGHPEVVVPRDEVHPPRPNQLDMREEVEHNLHLGLVTVVAEEYHGGLGECGRAENGSKLLQRARSCRVTMDVAHEDDVPRFARLRVHCERCCLCRLRIAKLGQQLGLPQTLSAQFGHLTPKRLQQRVGVAAGTCWHQGDTRGAMIGWG